MSDDDEGEDEVVEEVDITAGPESIAGTDDGDGDGDEEPTPSSPAPAAPDGETADLHLGLDLARTDSNGSNTDDAFETAPSSPTDSKEVDDLSAMLGGMGV
jgi:phosphate-selective porin